MCYNGDSRLLLVVPMVIKNVDIDNETLNGLNGVSTSDNDVNPDPTEPTPDQKYVMISLFTGDDKKTFPIKADASVPNPTIYDIDELQQDKNKSTTEFIKNKLREHCKKYGTVNEIIITSHGSPGHMSSKEDYYKINPPGILFAIRDIEEELGIKVTNRIVYAGCSTFSNLQDNTIDFYRDFAQKHHMEIVGLTSKETVIAALGSTFRAGRYVQFTPNGNVTWDKLDTPNNPFALLGNDKSWTDYFVGHTQEEGEALRNAKELQLKNAQEAETKRQSWENKCADYGPKF